MELENMKRTGTKSNNVSKIKNVYLTKSFRCQLLASCIAFSTIISIGAMLTVTSVLIGSTATAKSNSSVVDLNSTFSNTTTTHPADQEESLTITDEQASWLASLTYIIQPMGCLIGGLVQDSIGRKYGLMFMSLPEIIGWYLVYSAQNINTLYLAFFLMGIAIGFVEAPSVAYVCEILQPEHRGRLCQINALFCVLGCAIECLIASFFDWRTTALISMLLPLLRIPLLMFIPESPIWLLKKGRDEEAEQALCWLRGGKSNDDISAEFKEMGIYVSESLESKNDNVISMIRDMFKRTTRKPMIMMWIYIFSSLCAYSVAVRSYSIYIMKEYNSPFQAETIAYMMYLFGLMGNLICIYIVPKTGKRICSMLSITLCIVNTFIMATYIYFFERINQPWIICVLFLTNNLFTNMGAFQIPWVLMGEVYPLKTRALSVALSAAGFYSSTAFLNKTYIYIVNCIGLSGILALHATIGCLGLVYLYFNLPETEGKTLSEIEKYYSTSAADGKKNDCDDQKETS